MSIETDHLTGSMLLFYGVRCFHIIWSGTLPFYTLLIPSCPSSYRFCLHLPGLVTLTSYALNGRYCALSMLENTISGIDAKLEKIPWYFIGILLCDQILMSYVRYNVKVARDIWLILWGPVTLLVWLELLYP